MKLNKDSESKLRNIKYPTITKKEKQNIELKATLIEKQEPPEEIISTSKHEEIDKTEDYCFLGLYFSNKVLFEIQKCLSWLYLGGIIIAFILANFYLYFMALSVLLIIICLLSLFGIVAAFKNDDNNILFFNTVLSVSILIWIVVIFSI